MPESVIKYSDLIGEDNTFIEIFANIEKLKKELLDLTKATQKQLSVVNPNEEKKIEELTKEVERLTKQKKELDKQEKKAVTTRKKLQDLDDKELIAREKQKIVNRERVQIAKQTAILQSKEVGQIERLRAQLALTTITWKKLTTEEIKNNSVLAKSGKTAKQVIADKRRLTDQLKKLEKQTGDTRRNVGNYGDALGRVGKLAARVFVGRSIFDGLRRIGAGFSSLIEKNKETSESAASVSASIGKVGIFLEKIGLTIINVVAVPLASLISGFEKFSEAILGINIGANRASEGVKDLKNEFNAEIEVLKRGNISTEARKQLITDINKKYKDYLPNLIDENATLDEITTAQNAANLAFEKKIILLASEEQFVDITKRRLDALREEAKLQRELTDGETKRNRAREVNNTSIKSGVNQALTAANVQIAGTQGRIAANKILLEQIEEEKKQLDEVIKANGINTKDFIKNQKKKTAATKKSNKQEKKSFEDNTKIRLEAIEKLQDELEKSEGKNIKVAQERAFRLEQLRFEAQREGREIALQKIVKLQEDQEETLREMFKNDKEKLKLALEELNNEFLQIQGLFFDQEILDLEQHEQKKLDIREKFGIKTIEINTIRLQDTIDAQQDKELAALKDLEAKKNEALKESEAVRQRQEQDAAEKRKEREKELTQGIIESSKKIGEAIVANFQKQSELATSLVEQQRESIETQQQRAQEGLTNTLKFEKDQLAQREAEQIRAQQKAQSAAKILTLFNLVAAYAGSGDTNALARGLVDFSLLTALETALSGFEEGGYTGSDSSNKTVKGVVHANEFVLTADQTKRYGLTNKSAGDFGEAMTDYYNQQSPLLTNSYKQQNETFSSQAKTAKFANFSVLEAEVRAMRKTLQKQQNNEFEVERMTDYFVDIAKRVTKNRMTTIKKVRKRL
tara:strand:+ start:5814 stop:8561 length:2748 start_codon:yes stop_codon:yes gene_type:complete